MADIVFSEPAEYDLLDIEYYIHVELSNPQAAINVTEGILNCIETLGEFPKRHSFVNDEYLKEQGTRMIRFDNFNIFYTYDSISDSVYIIRILYSKVDWKNMIR